MQILELIDIEQIKKGDQKAFRDVYEILYDRLIKYVKIKIGTKGDAEDIVADAFAKLFENRKKLNSTRHLRRWLSVVVANACIDYHRAKNRHVKRSEELCFITNESYEYKEAEIDKLKQIQLRDILNIVDQLPLKQKNVLLLYFFRKKNTCEIATELKIKNQTVRNHKAASLHVLRKMIKQN